jgi:hypothetical protein
MSHRSLLTLVSSNGKSPLLKKTLATTHSSCSGPSVPCACDLTQPCPLLTSLTKSLQVLIANRPELADELVVLASTMARAAAKVCVLFLIT